MRKTGNYQKTGNFNHFIPSPLPPSDPPLTLDGEMMALYGEAVFALGKLNEMGKRLPDPKRFTKAYVIKEALLSSAIEGIHTTLLDVFTATISQEKGNKDTQLVLGYTKALDSALTMIQGGLPLSSRVLLKAHEELLFCEKAGKANPGFYRKQGVRVGDLIPPPAIEVGKLMGELEQYIHSQDGLPALIKAGLVHVQFETIHPFLDGNGRIGRLLIVLMLIESGVLEIPILYPSYYFKKHRLEYYERLDGVRTQGDFEGWMNFYLKAIRDSTLDAYACAKAIENLEFELKEKIDNNTQLVKMRDTARTGLEYLFKNPITDISTMSQHLGKAYNTVANLLTHFTKMGITSQNVAPKQSKTYRFEAYVELLEQEYL